MLLTRINRSTPRNSRSTVNFVHHKSHIDCSRGSDVNLHFLSHRKHTPPLLERPVSLCSSATIVRCTQIQLLFIALSGTYNCIWALDRQLNIQYRRLKDVRNVITDVFIITIIIIVIIISIIIIIIIIIILHGAVLLEKLTGFQLVKKLPAFHGTQQFITAFTSARHLSLS